MNYIMQNQVMHNNIHPGVFRVTSGMQVVIESKIKKKIH